MQPAARSALVLYGSETGTAQDAAEELGRLCERLHFAARVCPLSAVGIGELLRYSVVLVAISTTGQGDLPANARLFWKRLRSARLPPTCLAPMRFASFGLGDSSYPQYNWAHRKLYNRLTQLGAVSLCDRGEADEQHPEGTDSALIPWSSKLHDALLHTFPLPAGLDPIPEQYFLTPKWATCISTDHDDISSSVDECTGLPSADLIPIVGSVTATVDSNVRVTHVDHWQDVRLLDFRLPEADYSPGDILTVYPKNFPEDVDELLTLQGWSEIADRKLHFAKTQSDASQLYPPPPFDESSQGRSFTLRKLLTDHLDITAIPRRSFFAFISHFTTDQAHRERLIEFTQPELIDEFYDYTTRPRRSILEVLQEFHTVKIPVKWVASIFPVLRGRQFSIASGGALKRLPNGDCRVQLLVAIVKYKTVIKKIRQGVCTRYIASLRPGSRLNVTLLKGGMKPDFGRPCVMIGPGTGVAPLRSMVHERLQQAPVKPDNLQQQALFFGCRNAKSDLFFKDEWSKMQDEAGLNFFAAFSRDQREKVYVQDLIRRQSALVHELLKDGSVYICGSSGKMPQAVREALIEVFEKEGPLDRASAEARLASMEKTGRYQQETW